MPDFEALLASSPLRKGITWPQRQPAAKFSGGHIGKQPPHFLANLKTGRCSERNSADVNSPK